MNLLDDPWIPVRTASGIRRWIAPFELTDGIEVDPIRHLAAPRADFNGALIQFLIGLIQTAWERSGRPWDRDGLLFDPPSPQELRELFAPLRPAFEFDGDGARFMQDLTLGPDDKPVENPISALLVESPGEQSLERNTDHFVKRGGVDAICPDCAAAALFTLMTNAPAGGAGNRTSLRGGGPLTTLLAYEPELAGGPELALWRDVIGNVRDPRLFMQGADPARREDWHRFPWLAPIAETQTGEDVQPLDAHPSQVFWATPRRIRLRFDQVSAGQCELCGRESARRIGRYLNKNYGLNYKGPWRHPLSPYYRTSPDQPALPMHPQPGGLGYRHWLGWVLGTGEAGKRIEPASVLRDFMHERPSSRFRLWAFGYDMDNMKARCWYEATFPLFDLPRDEGAQDVLRGLIDRLLQSADLVAQFLRWSVRDAWFGDAGARGDLGFIDAGFWSATESRFFESVRQAVELVVADPAQAFESSLPLRRVWLAALRRAAFAQFDQHADAAASEAVRPERLAAAHRQLRQQLAGKKLCEAAGIPYDKPEREKRRAKAA